MTLQQIVWLPINKYSAACFGNHVIKLKYGEFYWNLVSLYKRIARLKDKLP